MKLVKWFDGEKRDVSRIVERLCLLVATTLLLIVLMTSVVGDALKATTYKKDEVAEFSVVSPRDFLVENTYSTEKQRLEAGEEVRRVFTKDDTAQSEPSVQLQALFSAFDELSTSATSSTNELQLSDELRKSFQQQYRLELTDEEWKVLADRSIWPPLEEKVVELVTPLFTQGIIGNKRQLRDAIRSNGAVLRRMSGKGEIRIHSSETLLDVNRAVSNFEASFKNGGFGRGAAFDAVVERLGKYLIRANIFYDTAETDRRIKVSREAVEPIYYQVKRGEAIVRAGDKVTVVQEQKLQRLRELQGSTDVSRRVIGFSILASLIIVTVYFFTTSVWPTFRPTNSDLGLIALTLVGSFFLIKVYFILGDALSLSIPDIDSTALVLAAPIAAGGILLQVTSGPASVFFFTTTFALLTGVFLEDTWIFLLLIIIGNIVGSIAVKTCSRRSAFLAAGFRVALVNIIIVFCFLILTPSLTGTGNTVRLVCALFGGLTSGVLAAGLTPIAEYIGGYVTDIKLLELASLDRPLLRDLALEAPGTWNHSMVVGQLADAAAEAIAANGLLARVGAYYHDIGKTKKPAYFTENQSGIDNRHDKLTPSMSALIIKAHVKDGIEMARQERLPKAITDFIPQHHGTSLIEFFYEKAKKEAEEGDEVDVNNYSYPGPKPQTKEAGILMLADGVEAATRSLADPTPTKIQGLVQKMVNKVFASGQLNESELTLRDLHLIAKAFTRVLNAIYHRRVEYGEPVEKVREHKGSEGVTSEEQTSDGGAKKRDASRVNSEGESSKKVENSSSEKGGNGVSKEALKRLGL